MWDSLESVWMAADADEGTDAYVVPIPYYDKNPDGSFREMHYEGNEYPDYVPVTSYEEYDFEERRPDIIFIHNPYDEFNYVTSVHPRFYSSNLKKFTEKLVYIPYFILGEIKPDDDAAIEGMKHFCINAAVKNADKVIVQSEDMRQVYIKVLMEAYGKSVADKKYWEEKILGLGSPKVDKVLNTRREDLEVPEKWLKIIQKMNGNWKKIVFYNTGVSALLLHDEKMLLKMREVFSVFRKNREEMTLLWRPHPLIKATISSMRPQLWGEYEEMEREYKEEGWGIYDDTADMNRAVCLSDAYYGDGSSIAQLYQISGKIVIFQSVDIGVEIGFDKETQKIKHVRWPDIRFSARCGNKLFCVSANYNAILSIDLNTGEVTVEGKLSDEKMEDFHLSGNIKRWRSYLIPAPFNARNPHVFAVDEKVDIILKQEFKTRKKDALGTSISVIIDQFVYYLPSIGKAMLRLDMQTMTVRKIENFYSEYQHKLRKEYKIFTQGGAYEYRGRLYAALYEDGYIMEFFCETEQWNYYKVAEAPKGFMQLVGIDNKLFLLSRDHKLIQWCIAERKTKSVQEIPLDASKNIENMQANVYNCEKIYYLAPGDTWGIKYDLSIGQIDVDSYENMWGLEVELGEKYRYSSYDGKGTIFLVSNKNHVYMVDIVGAKLKKLALKFHFDDIDKLFVNIETKNSALPFGGKRGYQILKQK